MSFSDPMRRFFLLFALCIGSGWQVAWADLVVIVNARSGVAAMTRNEVVHVFFGRNRLFFNGQEALPVDLQGNHPLREQFYRLLVGKELAEVDAYWSRQQFTGGLNPPLRVKSSEEVLDWVASRPGAIGFVELSRADARVRVVHDFLSR
ncbi:MAG: hypothetical protein ACK5JI_11375 [Azonexus sp.]